MARTRLRALWRALITPATDDNQVHFHNGPQGRPAPCYDGGCTSPRLDVR
jgi:hypothetical protein